MFAAMSSDFVWGGILGGLIGGFASRLFGDLIAYIKRRNKK